MKKYGKQNQRQYEDAKRKAEELGEKLKKKAEEREKERKRINEEHQVEIEKLMREIEDLNQKDAERNVIEVAKDKELRKYQEAARLFLNQFKDAVS